MVTYQSSISTDKTHVTYNYCRSAQLHPIIPPVDRLALCSELTPDKLLRVCKGLEIYVVTAHEAPHVMDEIGRIREVEFRREGGGTGQAKDIDAFDTGEIPYRQLVVWDAEAQEIVAMYRYILCRNVIHPNGTISLATSELFTFSDRFQRDYLPYTIELGRSVVNRSAKRKHLGLWVVWFGLGALVREYAEMQYLLGKVTMYPTYSVLARDILLHFLQLYCSDPEGLVRPKVEFQVIPTTDSADFATLFVGDNYQRDYLSLQGKLRELGESVPPLINSYLDCIKDLKSFGTSHNLYFGNTEETGLFARISSMNEKQRKRYVDSYDRINPKLLQRLRTEELLQQLHCLEQFIVAPHKNAYCYVKPT